MLQPSVHQAHTLEVSDVAQTPGWLDYFSASNFMPHGHCYLWRPDILWTNVLSDLVIAVAYFSIPAALVVFVRKRADFRFNWVFWMFAAFILLCGCTHLVEIWTIWHPNYAVQGLLKLITGAVSLATAFALWPLLPKALALPSTRALEAANRKLEDLADNLEVRSERRAQEILDARHKIREGEERLAAIQEAAGVAGWEWNLSTNEVAWSGATQSVLGFTPSNAGDFFVTVHSGDLKKLNEDLLISIKNFTPFDSEFRISHQHTGSIRWLRGVGGVVTDELGKAVLMRGVNYDITDRKLTELALVESETKFRVMTDAMPQMVWSTLPDGSHDYFNQRWYEFTGVSQGSTDGEQWVRLFHRDDQIQAQQKWRKSLETGMSYEVEYRLLHKSGVYRWVLGRALPVRDQTGAITRWMGTCTDIDEQKRASELLEQRVSDRTADLQAANRELEMFSYSVSHDLRAPLRGIHGFSDVLLQRFSGALADEAQGYLRRVKDAATRMGILIDDLLKLARLTQREMRLETVDIGKMAEEVVEDLRAREPQRHVSVNIEKQLFARVDPSLFRTVLENLLGNAWKFTRNVELAKIVFRAEKLNEGFVFSVSDNGAGFDMKYADKLFGAFQRLHSTAEFSGTGIGLASVQRILRRHGGEAWAKSETGCGATFFFTIDFAKPESGA